MRRRLKASGHETTKPGDLMATVNDAVVQGKFMFLSGEICLTGDRPFSSEALDDQASALWTPSTKGSETMDIDSADAGNRIGDQTEVSRGHSSRTPIVMDRTWRRTEPENQRGVFVDPISQWLYSLMWVGVVKVTGVDCMRS